MSEELTEMLVPLAGMTVRPMYFPSAEWDYMLGGMWAELMRWTIGEAEARAQFKRETGKCVERLVARDPLARLIDAATGFDESLMAAWCDWATSRCWGVAEEAEALQTC